MKRRTFVQGLAIGGGAALFPACTPRDESATGRAASQVWVKDPTPFIQHPTNLETRLELLQGLITPNELFFVRNHAPTPRIDAETYQLRIEGDGVDRPTSLTYDDILRLPSHSVVAYLECAGNWRSFWGTVLGQPAQGGQWGTGGVGCAEWTGTPLAAVLGLAGIKRDAVDVNLFGGDEGEFNRPMPVAKALDPNTLLAYAMNGAVLPPDHGYPIRAVVPGWVGSNSVKWVERIVVSTQKTWVKYNTTSYVMIGPEWPADRYAPASGGPITTQSIKSALALPSPARLGAGSHQLRGFAHSPAGRIVRVEWSENGGATWNNGSLLEPVWPHAWARFEFPWRVVKGSHTLTVRATDEQGNTQPNTVPFNEKGYLLNIPLPHPVEVA